MRLRTGWVCACAAAAVLSASARESRSQGFLIDRRVHVPVARSFEVREVALDARVRDQMAEVQVSQTFHNPGSFVLESEYLFPLPEDGGIQNFVLLVEGKELPGRIMAKEEARRIYEDIVRSKRDPALLEYVGRGLYKTSVFPIPPGADRKVTMHYTQICKRDRDVVEFCYPFGTQKLTGKPIGTLTVNVRVESRDSIKSFYCPTYDATTLRGGDHEARASLKQYDVFPSTDFRLIYTLTEGAFGASVLSCRPSGSEDGYFLLLASPQVKPEDVKRQPKTVLFVLDRSGSMAGKKIEQARNALKFVLGNLREDDTFNIIAYDDRVETYQPELQRYSARTREQAERFVENVREGGGTDIDSALRAALGMIQDESRPTYVLFLTDGLPTVGETKETAIAANCRVANKSHARVFSFGVGNDVNARLLDRLSGGNSGTTEYVKPDEDIEAHVARFYARLTSPALTDVRVELLGVNTSRIYPRDLPDLFDGGQLVVTGRYHHSSNSTVRISGKVGGDRRTFEFPADMAEINRGHAFDFVAKLWATRRIGDLIDQIDLHGQNKELVDELVALSTRHGILTPYTSFLADENVSLHANVENSRRAGRELRDLNETTGSAGVDQRAYKQRMVNADKVLPADSEVFAESVTSAKRDRLADSRLATSPSPGDPLLPAAVASEPSASASRVDAARGAFGAGPGAGGRSAPMGYGLARKPSPEITKTAVANVRCVGTKTFYKKGDRWVDSEVKSEDEAQAIVVRQFSDEFFNLARVQKSEMNQYLTFDETVTVNLDGRVYRFEQAAR